MLAIGTKRTMAANHTELLGLGVGAILAISAAPMYAVARHPSADTLKAEARNFVKIISGDKRKSQTYCKIVELNDQIDEKEDPIEARNQPALCLRRCSAEPARAGLDQRYTKSYGRMDRAPDNRGIPLE